MSTRLMCRPAPARAVTRSRAPLRLPAVLPAKPLSVTCAQRRTAGVAQRSAAGRPALGHLLLWMAIAIVAVIAATAGAIAAIEDPARDPAPVPEAPAPYDPPGSLPA